MKDREKNEKVRKPIYTNKAFALSLAVAMTLSVSLSGCGNNQNEEEDDSYYYGGGGGGYHGTYFYSSGSSYKSGSWGNNTKISSGKSGYSSTRGGSIGG